MVELGFSDMLSLAQTIGIAGTMVLTLYFSNKHIQSLSNHQQTRVLNDLDEKVRKMAVNVFRNNVPCSADSYLLGNLGS